MTVRCPFALGALLCLVACGVSPRPESADAQRLPERELDDATVRTVAATAQRAIEAVVNLQYPDAEQAALAALDLDPRCARARAVLAMVKLKRATPDHDQPELGAAEFELRLAQQLGPDDAFVGWMTAVFLAEAGHMAAAAQAADQALRTSNTASAAERAALLGIAGTYRHELGEERAAIPHLQEYVALRPDDITARYRLASALLRVADEPRGIPPTSYLVAQRQAEDAARAFTRVAEASPTDRGAVLGAVAAHLRAATLAGERQRSGAPDTEQLRVLATERDAARQAAAAMAQLAVARFPDEPDAWYQSAMVAEDAGDRQRALEQYQRALELDPRHVASALNCAEAMAAVGRRADAAAILRPLLEAAAGPQALSDDERRRVERWLRGD